MNHEHDLLSRLVDYHDHIAAPSVPVGDDLRRGRRRVRRNRGLLAGGVAVGLASVVAAVSLFTVDDSVDPPQPADVPRLTTPLVAPESVLDVRELGFHVEPVEGFDAQGSGTGWSLQAEGQEVTLRWEESGSIVRVKVLYEGLRDDSIVCSEREEAVTVHGVLGCYYDEPEEGVSIPTGIFDAYVVWEYAPDSWASVYSQYEPDVIEPGRVRSALLEVAEAVAPGGEETRVPVQASALSPLVRPEEVDSVSIRRLPEGVAVDFHAAPFYFNVSGGYGDLEDGESCEQPASGGSPAPFTFEGHAGCFYWSSGADAPPPSLDRFAHYIALEVDGTYRGITPRFQEDGGVPAGTSYPLADVKRTLADLTVATLDDPSTWFELKSAFSG